MTGDPPDPRFREHLAEALLLGSGGRQYWDPEELRDIVDDLAPLAEARESALRHQLDTALRSLDLHREAADRHAAEVEARVQAAAQQRAAEADALRHNLRELCDSASDGYVPIAWLRELAAAAQPTDGRTGA